MKFSQKISDAMEQKPGRLSKIKALGFYNTSLRIEKIREFFNALDGVGAVSKNVVFGRVNDTVVFFTQPEDEVIERILAIPDKKKGETPEKVLIKMIALRMGRIFEIVAGFKQYDEMEGMVRIAKRKTDFGDVFDKMINSSGARKPEVDDLRRMRDFIEFIWTRPFRSSDFGHEVFQYPHKNGHPWTTSSVELGDIVESNEVFNRPDVTPEIISKAWDLYLVDVVMKE